jgi:lipopolysaccharide export system protein LptA
MTAAGRVVLQLKNTGWLIDEDVLPATRLTQATRDEPVTVTTPRLDYDNHKQLGLLHGPVVIRQPKRWLMSDRVIMNDREGKVDFFGFHFEQDESRWLVEKGVIGSPPQALEREMGQRLTALSQTALYERTEKLFTMKGDVRVQQGSQHLNCSELVYDEESEKVELIGPATVEDRSTQEKLVGDHLIYHKGEKRFQAAGLVRMRLRLEENDVPQTGF